MTRISDKKLLADGRAALGAFHKAIDSEALELSLKELVKIRISQINGCAICLTGHWKIALEAGERVDRLATVSVWRESNWFTPREKAALAWAEALTRAADHHVTDDDYAAVRAEFSEEEVVDLTWTIISMNSWNRINVAFCTPPTAFTYPASEG